MAEHEPRPHPDRNNAESAADLEALRAGDRAAFERLVRRHHGALLAVARTMVGVDDADEVVQVAWIKAHGAIAGFEGRARVRTWLTRIVINEANMRLRKRRREAIPAGLPDEDTWPGRFDAAGGWQRPPADWSGDDPQDILDSEQLRGCLQKILRALPHNQRAVLELREFEGTAADTIARTLALSPANVRVLLHRARARLYRTIERFRETGEC